MAPDIVVYQAMAARRNPLAMRQRYEGADWLPAFKREHAILWKWIAPVFEGLPPAVRHHLVALDIDLMRSMHAELGGAWVIWMPKSGYPQECDRSTIVSQWRLVKDCTVVVVGLDAGMYDATNHPNRKGHQGIADCLLGAIGGQPSSCVDWRKKRNEVQAP